MSRISIFQFGLHASVPLFTVGIWVVDSLQNLDLSLCVSRRCPFILKVLLVDYFHGKLPAGRSLKRPVWLPHTLLCQCVESVHISPEALWVNWTDQLTSGRWRQTLCWYYSPRNLKTLIQMRGEGVGAGESPSLGFHQQVRQACVSVHQFVCLCLCVWLHGVYNPGIHRIQCFL